MARLFVSHQSINVANIVTGKRRYAIVGRRADPEILPSTRRSE
jgi:hypothetical protein